MLQDYPANRPTVPGPPAPPVVLPEEDDGRLRPNGRGGFRYSLPPLVPKSAPVAPRPESPFDIVGGGQVGNTHFPGQVRWKAEEERRKAELAREREELELEYRRWMINQMMGNTDGMNVRKLLTGGKYVN